MASLLTCRRSVDISHTPFSNDLDSFTTRQKTLFYLDCLFNKKNALFSWFRSRRLYISGFVYCTLPSAKVGDRSWERTSRRMISVYQHISYRTVGRFGWGWRCRCSSACSCSRRGCPVWHWVLIWIRVGRILSAVRRIWSSEIIRVIIGPRWRWSVVVEIELIVSNNMRLSSPSI